MSASSDPVSWNGQDYHRVSLPHQGWGAEVLSRLALRGDETVLDLGVGSGKVAEQLLARLPHGRVVGVDASASMLAEARRRLDGRATLIEADLLAFTVGAPADAAVSSATFHWIADHDALFARVRAALKPGAPFVAQCGGAANIASIVAALDTVGCREPFAPSLCGWPGPWHYAGPAQTRARLQRAGFTVTECFLNDSPVVPDDPRGFFADVILRAHLDRLGAEHHTAYVDAVLDALPDPPQVDYVRLNWVATAR